MKPDIRIFTQPEIMADSLAEEFYRYINQTFQTRARVNVALSGGTTPLLFFTKLGEFNQQRKNKIEWKRICFYWGDERCVSPDDEDSNYGAARKVLFDHIDIPEENVKRIIGEADPKEEIVRYAALLKENVPAQNSVPILDWIFLGVGDDGHTASIFPDQPELLTSSALCGITRHPESGQYRISLSAKVINAARRVTFMATGESKKGIVRQIINREAASKKYPAGKISPEYGVLDWYLDSAAADDI
ncbi:MAG: 6-phosphogluconolactonase [Bacteroidales bacterium]|nr:6-phosphogluconolactonase [Bacteroidales bacterium]